MTAGFRQIMVFSWASVPYGGYRFRRFRETYCFYIQGDWIGLAGWWRYAGEWKCSLYRSMTATEGGKRGSFGTESMRVFAFDNLITITVTCSYTFRRLKQVSLQSDSSYVSCTTMNPVAGWSFTYSGNSKERSYVAGTRTAQLSAPSLCDLQFAFLFLRPESWLMRWACCRCARVLLNQRRPISTTHCTKVTVLMDIKTFEFFNSQQYKHHKRSMFWGGSDS